MWTSLSLMLACTGPEPGTDDVVGVDSGVEHTVPDATLAWSDVVPTVATVVWTAEAGATGWVEYGLDGALDDRTPSSAGPDVSVSLLGLKAGRTYAWRAVTEQSGSSMPGPTGSFTVVDKPAGLARLSVERAGPAAMDSGYVLVSTTTALGGPDADAWVAIYDGDGDPVWWWKHPLGHVTTSPSLGTTPGTVVWDRYDMRDSDLWATATRVSLDGTGAVEVPLAQGHHAAIEPEPGVVAWIARDIRDNPYGPGSVTADRLYEAPIDGTEGPREVVALYDALFDGSFSSPCTHTQTGLVYEGLFPVYEWSHLNSLVYLADLDAYLLHLRWTDTVVLVDRDTGAIRWQLGGPGGDFTLASGGEPWVSAEQTLLSHAHISEAWDGGLVAFDNGTHRTPQVSSIVELAWDEPARTVREVFRWEDPQGRYVGALGDARRVPGGYLTTWAVLGEITEISSSGEVVWAATTAPLRSVSRAVFLEDLQ